MRNQKAREDAQRKAEAAQRKIDQKIADIERATRSLKEWQRRRDRYQKRAVMTDDQMDAERARASAAAALRGVSKRRGIAMDGVP